MENMASPYLVRSKRFSETFIRIIRPFVNYPIVIYITNTVL